MVSLRGAFSGLAVVSGHSVIQMRPSQILASVFIASFATSGIVEGYFGWEGESTAVLLHGLLIAVICFAWCKADISERGISEPTGSAILCGVLPPLGFPVYFFRSRRFGAALLATAIAIAIVLVSMFAYSLALDAGQHLRS